MLRPVTVALARQIAFRKAAPAASTLLLRSSKQWLAPAPAAITARFLSTVKVPDAPTSNHPHSPLPDAKGSIVYTETDEAPALATYSLYPYIAKVNHGNFVFVVSC